MSHEQLIKACKILLYKQNLLARKNAYERGELASMVNERTERVEKLAKSNLTEVTTFLHTVHTDFESFLVKHKKEHNNMNMRLLKVSEDMGSVLMQFKPLKSNMDQFATALACLVEFNSIEHALAVQDEVDREDMHLVGKTKQPKMPDKGLTPRYLNTLALEGSDENVKGFKDQLKGHRINGARAGTTIAKETLKANISAQIEKTDGFIKGMQSKDVIIKAGPVEMSKECLSCTGSPSHAIEMFKMACISYKPSQITYRSNLMTRKKLLQMRKALIDKCEEVINSESLQIE